ncbi:MAG TPA: TlpA disulfide reductase family protein [Roseovarius sp.]
MNGVALGPLVMDASRLAFIAAVVAFLFVADFRGFGAAARTKRQRSSNWAFAVLVAWIIGARAGFVVANSASFAAQPWDAFRLWQGGFAPWAGAGAAAVMIALAALRRGAAVAPLALGAVAAAAVFFAMNSAFTGPAPDLPGGTFDALRGPDVTLDDIDGPVVLNLWATWCPPCRREMPMMLDVAAQGDAATFVFANQGEGAAQIGRFLAAEGLAADHIVLDRQRDLMTTLGAKGLPATLIFDHDGALVQSHTGEISRAALERALREIATP